MKTVLLWLARLTFVLNVAGAGVLVATYFGFLPWLRAVAILSVALGALGAVLEKLGLIGSTASTPALPVLSGPTSLK